MKRIHKISRVRTIGGRRKAFRNIFRKNRGLIGKGYRKVAGKKILKKMTAKERKKTLRSGLFRGISKLNKNIKR